jgi:hypothetical protein
MLEALFRFLSLRTARLERDSGTAGGETRERRAGGLWKGGEKLRGPDLGAEQDNVTKASSVHLICVAPRRAKARVRRKVPPPACPAVCALAREGQVWHDRRPSLPKAKLICSIDPLFTDEDWAAVLGVAHPKNLLAAPL